MKSVFAILAFAGASMAHNVMTHFHINGVANPNCVRQAQSTNPLTVLDSDNMACNIVKGNAASKCTIKPGDAIAFEWRADPNIPAADYPLKDGTIPVGVTDDSHKGPCAVYMKKVSDSSTAVGAGDGWFKVSEDGLVNGVFCSDRLRLNNLPQPGVVPADIEAGDYLMRAEMLTLNNAGPVSNPPQIVDGVQQGGQPQFYVGCVQVTVQGTSGSTSPSTVSIPGYVNINTPGLIFDIWNTPSNIFSNYPMPGPTPLIPDGTAGTIAGTPNNAGPSGAVSVVPSATQTAQTSTKKASAPSTTVVNTPPSASSTDNATPTDDSGSDNTPTYVTPTYAAPTDVAGPTTAAPAPTTHTGNVKIVTMTTLITRTSTMGRGRPHTTSPAESGTDDDSEATPTGSDVPESTHHYHGYHGGRSHRRNRL